MEITNPVLLFAFIIFIVLAAPFLFKRLKLPGIVGLIVSGIIVGPHALGILKSGEIFKLFSSVGLVYIMFLAGLEINLSEFDRQKKNGSIFGFFTFIIPMIVGTFGSRYFFGFSWPTAILLASMFASHTLIPLPITGRFGINKERAVVSTVGGTILTDTAAMIVLAIIAENAQVDLTPIFWLKQLFYLAALIWFALWVLPRISYVFFKLFASDGGSEFLLTLALVFFTAYLAHLAGVEPIIGAFFAGLSLTRLIPEQSPLNSRLEFVGNTLFIPFFLISVGMLVDLRVLLFKPKALGIFLFMIIAAIFCKYLAAVIFTKLAKFTKDERYLIFGLSVNQAAATLAAVIVGLRLGIFNEAILNGTIIMIFFTCLIGPWFTEKYGERIARKKLKFSDHRPVEEERVLVAVGRSESAEFLTDVSLSLRAKDSKEPIFPLYVAQDGVDIDRRIILGEKILSGVISKIIAADVPVSPISRIDVNVPAGILRAVKECQASALVMGKGASSGTNLQGVLFDFSDKVGDESKQLFFLCRMVQPLSIGKSIFVFVPPVLEYQAGFDRALRAVINLASNNKLRIFMVGMPDTIKNIEKKSIWTGLTVDVSYQVLKQWKDFPVYLRETEIKEADSVVLMTVRKGFLGWQPYLKRLFHKLESELKGNNIMMAYLPDEAWKESQYEADYSREKPDPKELLVENMVKINKETMEEALPQLLESRFLPGSKILSEVTKNIFPLDPIELSPGVLLFHTYSRDVIEPVVLLGVSRKGIDFPRLGKQIQAFFVLISPKDQDDIHLRALTRVAYLAKFLKASSE